jgi:hypothetical protein
MGDSDVPNAFTESAQLARRIVYVHHGCGRDGRRDWRDTAGDVRQWRAAWPGTNDLAADSIVSEVLDDLMRFSKFEDAAAALGFYTLEKANADQDTNAELRALFHAVCEHQGPAHARWPGPGWKAFRVDSECPLAIAWRACSEHPKDCRGRVSAAPWSTILGGQGISVDTPPAKGPHQAIRFRDGDPRIDVTRFNEQLPLGIEPSGITYKHP